MNEKELSEFQQGDEAESNEPEEGQDGQRQDVPNKEVRIYSKPGTRSCSFVRNWGGWEIGGE